MATMFFCFLFFPLNILVHARFLKVERRQENTEDQIPLGEQQSREMMVKDKYIFQLKFHLQGEFELLTRMWKTQIGSESWSIDSYASLTLDRMQPPHSILSTTSQNVLTQSESLILRTILYLGLIL